MTPQEALIGSHPSDKCFICDWLDCEDIVSTDSKKHRKLSEKASSKESVYEEIGKWLLIHHIRDDKLERLRKKEDILKKYDLQIHMKAHYPFPINESTKKGNCTEVIFSEYLQYISGLRAIIYKLHYTPNVEQAMKGDDCLLFDRKDLLNKVLVAEAKFRKSPNKQTVLDIVSNLEGQKRLPTSLTFVANCLSTAKREDEAGQIEDLLTEIYKENVSIINAGFLLSSLSDTPSKDTFSTVEKHLECSNQKLVFVSLGIESPENLVEESFRYATKLYYDTLPDLIEEFTKAE